MYIYILTPLVGRCLSLTFRLKTTRPRAPSARRSRWLFPARSRLGPVLGCVNIHVQSRQHRAYKVLEAFYIFTDWWHHRDLPLVIVTADSSWPRKWWVLHGEQPRLPTSTTCWINIYPRRLKMLPFLSMTKRWRTGSHGPRTVRWFTACMLSWTFQWVNLSTKWVCLKNRLPLELMDIDGLETHFPIFSLLSGYI